jgi:hypothetical protein
LISRVQASLSPFARLLLLAHNLQVLRNVDVGAELVLQLVFRGLQLQVLDKLLLDALGLLLEFHKFCLHEVFQQILIHLALARAWGTLLWRNHLGRQLVQDFIADVAQPPLSDERLGVA